MGAYRKAHATLIGTVQSYLGHVNTGICRPTIAATPNEGKGWQRMGASFKKLQPIGLWVSRSMATRQARTGGECTLDEWAWESGVGRVRIPQTRTAGVRRLRASE